MSDKTADLTPKWDNVLRLFRDLAEQQFGPISNIAITKDGDIYVIPNMSDRAVYKFDPEDDVMVDGTFRHFDYVSTDKGWLDVLRITDPRCLG